jgi:hypothetical protein
MTAFVTRVLTDVNMGRVKLSLDDRVTITGTFVDPADQPEYVRTVRVLLDASWVMEARPGGHRTGQLCLTTIGEIKLIKQAQAVTV